MELVGVASLFFYDAYLYLYFRKIYASRERHWIFLIAAIAINVSIDVVAIHLAFSLGFYHIGFLLFMGAIMVVIGSLFHCDYLKILYAGGIHAFSFYSSRGIVISLLSMTFNISASGILQSDASYSMLLLFTVLVSVLLQWFVRKFIMSDSTTKYLLKNRVQLRFIVLYLYIQLTYLMFINDGPTTENYQLWFSLLYMVSCILSKLGLQLVINHAAKVSRLMETELHTRQLQDHLSCQMQHYQTYQELIESYRAFRHDYKNMMTSVKTLLNNQEYEQAVQVLDDIHDIVQKDAQNHKTYSNNVLLDAILQDTANTCLEKGIHFSAVAPLPEDRLLADVDILRVFSNIMDNAVEACSKIPGPDRFIEIKSSTTHNWTTIEVLNPFYGDLLWKEGNLETTKDNKDFHGLGLRIVRKIIEGTGGLMVIEIDQEKKIFKLILCIPKSLE